VAAFSAGRRLLTADIVTAVSVCASFEINLAHRRFRRVVSDKMMMGVEIIHNPLLDGAAAVVGLISTHDGRCVGKNKTHPHIMILFYWWLPSFFDQEETIPKTFVK
jgi:hypothetical protein